MKKILNIFIYVMMIFIIISIFNINSSFATINPDEYEPNELTSLPGDYEITFANKIIGAFQAIGSIVSVIALVLIGVKYMMGSVEEKAEYKEKMINYVIGAILVFAISNISAMIYDWATTLNN